MTRTSAASSSSSAAASSPQRSNCGPKCNHQHHHHSPAAAAAAAAAARQHHINPNGTMAVYAPGFKYVLNLPKDAIVHLPPASLNVTRLVLCSNYDARDPKGSCSMGERCKFVHADTGRAREHNIHVNYAWRSVEEVTYERFPAGTDFHVAPPNTKVPSDVMDSGLVLKTKALESTRRPLSHCAHYYFNRTCNLGSDCHFIHAVFVDPTAKQHQRAPVPSQLGEGRELQLSKRQKEAQDEAIALARRDAVVAPLPQPAAPRAHHPMPRLSTGFSSLPAFAAAAASPSMALDSSLGPHGDASSNSSVNSARGIRSSPSSSSGSSGGARFRHHPYDLNASRIITVACHC